MRHSERQSVSSPVVGIVGGLASGKSTVAGLLARRGAAVVDADKIGHGLLKCPAVRQALTEAFGEDILNETGDVDRPVLAEIVFGAAERVRELNRIVHPRIIRRVRSRLESLKQKADVPLVVLDAALLIETDLHRDLCQALLFVEAPEQLRRRRAQAGRNMSAEQFQKRTQAQIPPAPKRKLADFSLNNTGSIEELDRQVGQLWPELCRAAGRVSPVHLPPDTPNTI